MSRLLGWLLFGVKALGVAICHRKVDLIYGSSPQPFAALAGLLGSRIRGVPFVLEVRDLWPESIVAAGQLARGSLIHRLFCCMERYIAKGASTIVCVTRGWEDHYAELGVDRTRIVVISNGAEPADFTARMSRAASRDAASITGFTAIFAGAHGPMNGLDLLLDAAKHLPQINFLLLGSGPSKPALIERSHNENIHNVRFMDPVPKHELPHLLRACDVGVHTVTPLSVLGLGMSPNKIFDYMSAALPIVSNAEAGLRQIMKDKECGRLGSSKELEACLRAVYEATAEERQAWGQQALRIVRDRYSRSAAARQLEMHLDEAYARHFQSGKIDIGNEARVAHITTAHPHLDNRIFHKECVALATAGLDVHLIAVAPQDLSKDGVQITALPRHQGRFARMFIGPFDAWTALRRVDPSMIHVHDPELIPLAIFWRLLRRRPAVYDSHEDLAKQVHGKGYIPKLLRAPASILASLLEKLADTSLDGVVAASPAIARKFSNTAALVQNFPWLRDFPEPSGPPSRDGRDFSMCYVGGINEDRGGIEMIRCVGSTAVASDLFLAGAISEQLLSAVESDETGHVKYLGILPVERVPEVIANSDVGLVLLHPLPNYLESQPTKLFEYMAAGRPFIASNFSTWQDLVERFDCGYFINPTDVRGLAHILNDLAEHPVEAGQMGARGRKAMIEYFTFENESEKLIAVTRDLLSAHARRQTLRHSLRPAANLDGQSQ